MTLDPKWFKYHDIFNLITLPIVCFSNIYYLISNIESYYIIQYVIFMVYLICDTLWLLIRPQSVASAKTVLPHHFVCILGWNLPYLGDRYFARWVSIGLLVEVNTLLLIARRNTKRNIIFESLFYITWIIIRCIIYPISLYQLIFVYFDKTNEYITISTNKSQLNEYLIYINTGLGVLVFLSILNFLNFKWTYDLFKKTFIENKKLSTHAL